MVTPLAALVNTYCNCIRGEGYLLERFRPATGPNAQKVITHDAVKIHRDRFSLQVQLSGYISELKDTFNPEKGKIRYMIVCMCTIYSIDRI